MYAQVIENVLHRARSFCLPSGRAPIAVSGPPQL
jgi:hypothetical protein